MSVTSGLVRLLCFAADKSKWIQIKPKRSRSLGLNGTSRIGNVGFPAAAAATKAPNVGGSYFQAGGAQRVNLGSYSRFKFRRANHGVAMKRCSVKNEPLIIRLAASSSQSARSSCRSCTRVPCKTSRPRRTHLEMDVSKCSRSDKREPAAMAQSRAAHTN